MERIRRRIGFAVVALMFAAMISPEVAAVRYIVGGNMGWASNVNYTIWAQGRHFHNGDWLFFVYDRHQMNVLEVNETDYEKCISDHPLHNWTTGAGRDDVPLNATKTYYFISGKGFCFGGMKVAILVENPPSPPGPARPPSPSPSPIKSTGPARPPAPSPSPIIRSGSPRWLSTFRGQIFAPAVFAAAAVWNLFLLPF